LEENKMDQPELSADTKRALIHAIETSLTKFHIERLKVMIGRERTDNVHREVAALMEWLQTSINVER
jgi:hypothetical protein